MNNGRWPAASGQWEAAGDRRLRFGVRCHARQPVCDDARLAPALVPGGIVKSATRPGARHGVTEAVQYPEFDTKEKAQAMIQPFVEDHPPKLIRGRKD